MVKPASEPRNEPARTEVPPLSATVRRHLGKNLRTHYAAALSEPVAGPISERLEALLAKLRASAGQGV